MTFQYFFFDAYAGDVLRVLPPALPAGAEQLTGRRRSVL